jgi:hypothetical protein
LTTILSKKGEKEKKEFNEATSKSLSEKIIKILTNSKTEGLKVFNNKLLTVLDIAERLLANNGYYESHRVILLAVDSFIGNEKGIKKELVFDIQVYIKLSLTLQALYSQKITAAVKASDQAMDMMTASKELNGKHKDAVYRVKACVLRKLRKFGEGLDLLD